MREKGEEREEENRIIKGKETKREEREKKEEKEGVKKGDNEHRKDRNPLPTEGFFSFRILRDLLKLIWVKYTAPTVMTSAGENQKYSRNRSDVVNKLLEVEIFED
ncbi:hypothetical protein TNCV_1903351 [Trichonephila clavipes]|nr:hypothetical protein TNCV_1903351 [Trichonephila clavipes]